MTEGAPKHPLQDVLHLIPVEHHETFQNAVTFTKDNVPVIKFDIPQLETGRNWHHKDIKQTTYYLPLCPPAQQGFVNQFYNNSPTRDKPYPTGADIVPYGGTHNKIKDPWSYYRWETLRQISTDQDGKKLARYLTYFTALSSVTPKFGRPIDALFIRDLRNFCYVSPPEDLSEELIVNPTEEPLGPNEGYALWILGVRLALKSNAMDDTSTMVSSILKFLKIENESAFRLRLKWLANTLKSHINTDSPICHSEAATRRGMNINYAEIHQIAIEQDQITVQGEWIHPQEIDITNNIAYVKHSVNTLFVFTSQMPHYNKGFWSFAQVGIARNGWSAMEMLMTGFKQYDLDFSIFLSYFPTETFLKFTAACISEQAKCLVDPWRDTSHLLAPNINTPLSAAQNQVVSYVGTCLVTDDLDPRDPPDAIPGIKLTRALKEKLAYLTDNMITNGSRRTTSANPEIARLFRTTSSTLRKFEDTVVPQKKERPLRMSRLISSRRRKISSTSSSSSEAELDNNSEHSSDGTYKPPGASD